MEAFSVLLAICAGGGGGGGGIPRTVTRGFGVFFGLRLGKRLSRRSWGWWFGTLSCPLLRHCYDADGHLHIQHWWVRGPQIATQNPTAP